MNTYMIERMATVGCGISDIHEIETLATDMTRIQKDTLEAMRNFGLDTSLTPAGEKAKKELRNLYPDDTLKCLAEYVSVCRDLYIGH